MHFLARKIVLFGAKKLPKLTQNGDKNLENSWTFRVYATKRAPDSEKRRPSLDMDPDCCHIGPKMEPKWSPKEAKRRENGAPDELKWIKNF